MKTLIILHSYHHNNTKKIAEAIAEVLEAEIREVEIMQNTELIDYDLVGFGAGIDSDMHYKELLDYANTITINTNKKKCFIFSTSAVQGEKKVHNDHTNLRNILISKEYEVVGEFSCKGYNTNSFLKFIGGMNKKHPNEEDLINAKEFAEELLN